MIPAILRASSLFSPKPGSTSNSPLRKLRVFSDMCTRLQNGSRTGCGLYNYLPSSWELSFICLKKLRLLNSIISCSVFMALLPRNRRKKIWYCFVREIKPFSFRIWAEILVIGVDELTLAVNSCLFLVNLNLPLKKMT